MLPTTRADDAGDLLARGFNQVLAKLRGELSDLVVIDCPPLVGLEDTRSIAPLAGGVLLVVTVGSDTEPVNEAVLTLEALRAPLLGVVANRVVTAERSIVITAPRTYCRRPQRRLPLVGLLAGEEDAVERRHLGRSPADVVHFLDPLPGDPPFSRRGVRIDESLDYGGCERLSILGWNDGSRGG